MTEHSKSQKKREVWEEKEARLLRRNVYDHLAYYIQVQLPEKKFVRETTFQRSIKQQNSKSPQNERHTRKKKASNLSRAHKTLKEKEPRPKKQGSKSSAAQTKLSDNSSESENESQSKNRTPDRKATHRPSSNLQKIRPTSRRKVDFRHESFRSSPYAAELRAKDMGRSKTAESMRKEAERVAATTTKLLGELSLTEVMAIQKYRSPAKSLLSCSSSLSEHPNGMLSSNKAVRYAAKNDDRESARRYMSGKKRKEAERARKQRQRENLTSSQSYRRKYQRSLLPIVAHETESSSDSTDDTATASTSTMSSYSTIRKAGNRTRRTVSVESQRMSKGMGNSDVTEDISNEMTPNASWSSPRKVSSKTNTDDANNERKQKRHGRGLKNSEDSATEESDSSESLDEATVEMMGSLENVSKRGSIIHEKSSHQSPADHVTLKSASNHVEKKESSFVNSIGSNHNGSSSEDNDVTMPNQVDGTEKASESDKESVKGAKHENYSSSTTVPQNKGGQGAENLIIADIPVESQRSSSQTSDSENSKTVSEAKRGKSVEKASAKFRSQRSLSRSSDSESSKKVSEAKRGKSVENASAKFESQRSSSRSSNSSSSNPVLKTEHQKTIKNASNPSSQSSKSENSNVVSENHGAEYIDQNAKIRAPVDDVFPPELERTDSNSILPMQTTGDQSDTDNNDASSMTSSLRKIIEEAQDSLSDFSSQSSSSSSDDANRSLLEEQIFGSSLPDLNSRRVTTEGRGPFLESGGEILEVDRFKPELI